MPKANPQKTSKPLAQPIETQRFSTSEEGWQQFGRAIVLRHYAGYDLTATVQLAGGTFGAVWKLVRPAKPRHEANLLDEEDIDEEGAVYLPD